MRKKLLTLGLSVVLAGTMLTGCGGSEKEEAVTIGIQQFAEHGSLDNCREGFLKGLEEEGYTEGENLEVKYENAQSDTGAASQIATNFLSEEVDLMCAIATPSAMACYNVAEEEGIPVIYTAVSDPVAAKLADKDGKPVGEVTGTSDAYPYEKQLELIRQILPEAKKIGILHTTSETNSDSQLASYQKLAKDYDFEVVERGVSASADIPTATDSILKEVDCIVNLTDNTVVSSLPTILDKANEKNIPVFGSEIEQVKIGCLAAAGLDYMDLGEQTGKMAAKVLKGEKKASEMNYEVITEPKIYVNEKVADNMKIKISDDVKADETFDKISESK
ncbi:ABC transporter substrate-binding protein [Anaerostipes sp. 992a]|uniref:ABC transporter substrate-binding protein n=1 Tax=Anaerostipes sp. 992a TaxID=1261637 RepID=UPI0009535591|nr:ABC transporter substrate-binding protein [Anaerostipes sp. 992a]OLR62210.1 ABC transporter substrate-binding protein [Anaerostipes sp. 992a]